MVRTRAPVRAQPAPLQAGLDALLGLQSVLPGANRRVLLPGQWGGRGESEDPRRKASGSCGSAGWPWDQTPFILKRTERFPNRPRIP